MKKIFGLLSILLLLTSCDDGNFTVKSFDFDPLAPVKACSTDSGLYFKYDANSEALMLQTPPSTFSNDITPDGQPKKVVIDANNQVVYRTFNANVTDGYFCSVIPPSSPKITDEWHAVPGVANQSGIIEVTTTATVDSTSTITGYNHQIVFKNITFSNGKKSFSYDTYTFGNYTTLP